jgi:hypothetical protein
MTAGRDLGGDSIGLPLGLSRRLCAVVASLSVGATLLGTARAGDTVLVQRDTQISERQAAPYVLVRTPAGGYLVAGSSGITDEGGWAVQLDSNGKQRWEFLDGQAATPELRRHARGRLNGAVALDNGYSLFCGEKDHVDEEPTRNSSGRIVIVDSNGHAEARDVYAKGDSQGLFTAIKLCFKWSDGVALLGTNGSGSGWLVRLDSKGQFSWEKLLPFGIPLDAIETPDHHLLVLSAVLMANGAFAQLDKLDARGTVASTRKLDGGDKAAFVRTWLGDGPIAIVTLDRTLTTRLIHVDLGLKDVAAPVLLGTFYSYKNYFLPDRTIAMFGGVPDLGDTAAVAWVRASNKLNVLELEPAHSAFTIYDSAPSSSNEFAVLRRIHLKPFLGWISFAH